MIRISAILGQLRSGVWLNRGRVIAYARVVFVIEILALIFFTLGTHGLIVPVEKPAATDFVSFYAAGSLADHGVPAAAYDRPAHEAMEHRVSGLPFSPYNYFFYPPTYLLICALLPALPYLVSFVVFETVTGVAYLLAIQAIVGEAALLLPFVAFPAFFWTIGIGQNALLTAALFGGATAQIDRRPALAGVLFGCLCYKPHLALLVPVALLAGRCWKAAAAAAVTVAAAVAASVLLFGWAPWLVYWKTALAAQSAFQTGAVGFAGLVSPFAAALLVGATPAIAYALQLGITALLAGFVAYVWWRKSSLPVRAMALTAATVPAVPVVLFYDLLIPAVALAWLVRIGMREGFRPWEKAVACLLFVTPLVSRGLGLRFHLAVAPVTCLLFVILVFVRARTESSMASIATIKADVALTL